MYEPGRSTTGADGAGTPGPSPMHLLAAALGMVALAVDGRLWQPAYNVSPIVAIAVCSGMLFARPAVAAVVPAVALAVSNLFLSGGGEYGSWAMAAVVYAAFTWPVLLGPFVRSRRLIGPLGAALAGSLVFFLSTNLAHWWLGHDYPHTLAGLAECFVAALPFYRWMPVGDAAWTAVLASALTPLVASTARTAAREVA